MQLRCACNAGVFLCIMRREIAAETRAGSAQGRGGNAAHRAALLIEGGILGDVQHAALDELRDLPALGRGQPLAGAPRLARRRGVLYHLWRGERLLLVRYGSGTPPSRVPAQQGRLCKPVYTQGSRAL